MSRRLIPILILTMLLTSCQLFRSPLADPEPDLDFTREEFSILPGEVADWADNSRTLHLTHTKVYQGKRYILASYGEKPTGGYGINIEDVDIEAEKVTVTVNYIAPEPGQAVPEILTYPRDIVSIANLDLPIEYVGTGDQEYVPTLMGIEELPKIRAQSAGIKVFSPAPGSSVSKTFTAEGVANLFEGAFSYLLRDADGTPTPEQTAMAGMGDWYYFRLEIEVPDQLSQEFLLELFSHSAQDGSVINMVEVPLNREQVGD